MQRKLFAVTFALFVFNLFIFSSNNSGGLSLFSFGTVWFFIVMTALQIFFAILFLELPFTKKHTWAVGASAIAVLSAFLSLFRASEVDRGLLGVTSMSFSVLASYLFALTHQRFGALTEVFAAPVRVGVGWLEGIGTLFGEVPQSVEKVWKSVSKRLPKVTVKHSVQASLVRGLFITLPILGLLFILLASADPIFSQKARSLFSISLPNLPTLGPRFILSFIFLSFIAPFAWMKISARFTSPLQSKELKGFHLEAMMLTGSVAILLGLFLLIQFRYLFTTVSETELHQFGVATYSEYVRKGFGELLLVSAIVYVVAGFSMVVHRLLTDGNAKLQRTLNVILLSEAMIFIFSIMRRVWLYQTSHGLSRIRVYGMAFLVLLVIWTITLLLRHFQHKKYQWYLYEIGAVVAVIFLTLWFDTDQKIAQIFKPTVNQEIDYTYIARLSPDAVDGWIEAYQHAKAYISQPEFVNKDQFTEAEVRQLTYSQQVIHSLKSQRSILSNQYEKLWSTEKVDLLDPSIQGMNFAEYEAYRRARQSIFTSELDGLNAKVSEYLSSAAVYLPEIRLDRSRQTPLVK